MTVPHVVYISFDGMLEPLGQSQVAALLSRLASLGEYRITLVSFEKAVDIADGKRLTKQRLEFERSKIRWIFHTYEHGVKGIASNIVIAAETVSQIHDSDPIALIHARSYPAACVALTLKLASGVPYLFDFRGYWIDERIEDGRWFKGYFTNKASRALEKLLFSYADGIVSLTELAMNDVIAGKFGTYRGVPILVIPTCVDETKFGLNIASPRDLVEDLSDRLVLGFVGSINASYCVDESLKLVEMVCNLRPDAFLLCLTRQRTEMLEKLTAFDIREAAVYSVTYDDMPAWLSMIDWGLLLLNHPVAKRGSMPTKLGEFFASGVRPVQFGGNVEVCESVRKAGTGLVLDDLSDDSLIQAAQIIAENSCTDLASGRERMMKHFSLSYGVTQYAKIYHRILNSEL